MSLAKKHCLAIFLSVCAAFGGVVLALSTRWGLGLSPDSAVYIGAARSLLQGDGFSLPTDSGEFAPIAHYPPLYPVSLALFGFGGLDPVAAAKWLNVLLFCGNIFLAGVIAFVSTASSGFSVITSSLVATAYPMVLIHSMAWSEPLFVFLELLGILFLLFFLWQTNYWSLAAASAAIGLSILSRYAGLALVASGAAGILLLGARRWKSNVFDAGIFLCISLLPFGLWLLRNRWVAGSATNRQIGFHSVGFDRLGDAIRTLVSWFSAFSYASTRVQLLTVCVTALGGLAFLLSSRRETLHDETVKARRPKEVSYLMALIVANYLLLLVVSISLLDAQIPVDTRILSPGYVALVLLAVSWSACVAQRTRAAKNFRLTLSAVALLILGLQLPSTLQWLKQLHRDGMGYSSRGWTESALIKQLTGLDPSVAIFSNAPDVVYTLLGRPAAMIPRKIFPDSNLPNPDYDSQIAAMKKRLKISYGLLVYFNRVRWRWYLPSVTELEETIGLRLIIRTDDGSVYRVS